MKVRFHRLRTNRKLNRSAGGNFLLFLVLALLGAFMVLPLLYAFVSAFKPMEELFIFPPRFFVANPTLDNFIHLSQILSNYWVPFSRYLFNSVFVSVVATFGSVMVSSMAAYPMAKHSFPGRKPLSDVVVLALLFTPQVLYIPQYIIIAKLGLINTYGALILPAIQSPLGVFLMKQFMTQIPTSLLEASRIDGANEFTTWWKVVMPSVKPAWLTLIIFAFQSIWNQPGNSYVYDEAMKVLPSIMSQIQAGGLARAGVVAAVALVMMIPPLVLFQLTQRSVIETMTTSGIKE
ncbi:MAG TPA: carbohydrate ABC transporter permease [Termitinemataceae bacterium]|nr:carbohydrate ABC transporter permease [Termitinemataceae bacterium]HOM24006.1 carbohydrate ABC transporter permease [Termitinemataceae bacterium]HPQ00615.1 carbohydrate ABC transporter permease [Termitinemataceae bacterium]